MRTVTWLESETIDNLFSWLQGVETWMNLDNWVFSYLRMWLNWTIVTQNISRGPSGHWKDLHLFISKPPNKMGSMNKVKSGSLLVQTNMELISTGRIFIQLMNESWRTWVTDKICWKNYISRGQKEESGWGAELTRNSSHGFLEQPTTIQSLVVTNDRKEGNKGDGCLSHLEQFHWLGWPRKVWEHFGNTNTTTTGDPPTKRWPTQFFVLCHKKMNEWEKGDGGVKEWPLTLIHKESRIRYI